MAQKGESNSGGDTGAKGRLKNAERSIGDDLEVLRMIITESGPLHTVVMDKLKLVKARIEKEAKGGAPAALTKNKT